MAERRTPPCRLRCWPLPLPLGGIASSRHLCCPLSFCLLLPAFLPAYSRFRLPSLCCPCRFVSGRSFVCASSSFALLGFGFAFWCVRSLPGWLFGSGLACLDSRGSRFAFRGVVVRSFREGRFRPLALSFGLLPVCSALAFRFSRPAVRFASAFVLGVPSASTTVVFGGNCRKSARDAR